MNPPEAPANPGSLKAGVELASEILSLLAAGLFLYRVAVPDGPEPLELLRDAWEDAKAWARSQRQYRAAMLETLERIRDLPETEGRRMNTRAVLRAYGLWLLGVLSAAAGAYFLWRSRIVSVELEGEAGDSYPDDVYELEGNGLSERLADYTG